MKKIALAVALLAAAIPLSAQDGMRVAITPGEMQFGPSPLKIPVFKNFYIYNLGQQDYVIESITPKDGAFSVYGTSCGESDGNCIGCSVGKKFTLTPGQFCAGQIFFDPQRLGKFGGVITILDNDGDHILFLTGESVEEK